MNFEDILYIGFAWIPLVIALVVYLYSELSETKRMGEERKLDSVLREINRDIERETEGVSNHE